MRIGILQTGHLPDEMRAETGDYDQLFENLLAHHGLDLTVYNVVDMEFPSGIDAEEGWLITGSKHGVYEDHPWIPPLEAFIREAHAAAKPMVGICFGHQIIAQALGGKVEKFDGGWAIGRHVYDWEGGEIALNAWHQDQVIAAPEGAKVISKSPFCANAALVYGSNILTVQAHPEFTSAEIDYLLRFRAPGLVPEPLREAAAANLDAPVENERLAARIAEFFRSARHG